MKGTFNMTEFTTQSRWKSPVVYVQIVTIIISALQLTGVFESIGLDAGEVQDFIVLIITGGFNVFAGLNNPTNSKGF